MHLHIDLFQCSNLKRMNSRPKLAKVRARNGTYDLSCTLPCRYGTAQGQQQNSVEGFLAVGTVQEEADRWAGLGPVGWMWLEHNHTGGVKAGVFLLGRNSGSI